MSDAARAKLEREGYNDKRGSLIPFADVVLLMDAHAADQMAALREQNARLRGALQPYLHHKSLCRGNDACSCGLNALLADPEGQRAGEETS